MPIASRVPYLPASLQDFPWADMLVSLGPCPFGRELEVRIWHPYRDVMRSPQHYFGDAAVRHAAIWKWLEERFEMSSVPSLDSEGYGFQDRETSAQEWRNLAHFSLFRIGTIRSTQISRVTSSKK